ncbi:hypothetical protein [Hyalangium gracile]|uniref:hypothetical protein n=1 Tax=Hyalangium gracile TaxID=394092 RepID=UPI001CCCE0D9|nr:hypothetical protein [Hyalangium gracile]
MLQVWREEERAERLALRARLGVVRWVILPRIPVPFIGSSRVRPAVYEGGSE